METIDDIELTCRALKACGYRVHVKEKHGERWVTAVNGLDVRYTHWYPLFNINQAMQLLIDAPHGRLSMNYCFVEVTATRGGQIARQDAGNAPTPQDLINAQCRAIVTACASLEVVR